MALFSGASSRQHAFSIILTLQRSDNAAKGLFLLAQRVRCQPEFLDALSVVDFSRVDVPEPVDGHGMHPVKFTGLSAAAAEAADDSAVLAPDDADLVVLAIGGEQICLLRIGPKREVPDSAVAEGVLLVKEFLHEAAVLAEHLNAVVDAVADIDEPVIGDLHAIDR